MSLPVTPLRSLHVQLNALYKEAESARSYWYRWNERRDYCLEHGDSAGAEMAFETMQLYDAVLADMHTRIRAIRNVMRESRL